MNAQVDNQGFLLKTGGGGKPDWEPLRDISWTLRPTLPALLADEVSSMHSDDC